MPAATLDASHEWQSGEQSGTEMFIRQQAKLIFRTWCTLSCFCQPGEWHVELDNPHLVIFTLFNPTFESFSMWSTCKKNLKCLWGFEKVRSTKLNLATFIRLLKQACHQLSLSADNFDRSTHKRSERYLYHERETNKQKKKEESYICSGDQLNSIKRLLAIIMIYKVTSQTDLRRQPERNPTQIQLPFTWLPPPTPSARGRPRTGNAPQTRTPSALNSPF